VLSETAEFRGGIRWAPAFLAFSVRRYAVHSVACCVVFLLKKAVPRPVLWFGAQEMHPQQARSLVASLLQVLLVCQRESQCAFSKSNQ
jgi:hypothetical protein